MTNPDSALDFLAGFGSICASFGFLLGLIAGTWITAVCRKCEQCKKLAWAPDPDLTKGCER